MFEIRKRQSGLSIVELMVAMVVGLLLLGGVSSIYFGSNQTHRSTENLARLQENARFAMDFLATDIRQAANKGNCSRDAELKSHLNLSASDSQYKLYDLTTGIRGWDGTNSEISLEKQRPNTDSVLLTHGTLHTGVTASGNTQANSNSIGLTGPSGVKAGQIVVVSDGTACDMFQNTNNESANSIARGATGNNPGNKVPGNSPFSKAYSQTMEINSVRSAVYYIGDADDGPELRRKRYDTTAQGEVESLVSGIQDMQLCYGVDSDDSGDANSFVSASSVGSSNWHKVVAVRVSLLAVSQASNLNSPASELGLLDCDGSIITPKISIPAGSLGRVYSATIAIRNRLP